MSQRIMSFPEWYQNMQIGFSKSVFRMSDAPLDKDVYQPYTNKTGRIKVIVPRVIDENTNKLIEAHQKHSETHLKHCESHAKHSETFRNATKRSGALQNGLKQSKKLRSAWRRSETLQKHFFHWIGDVCRM